MMIGPVATTSESSSSRIAIESSSTPVNRLPVIRPMYIVPRLPIALVTCALMSERRRARPSSVCVVARIAPITLMPRSSIMPALMSATRRRRDIR
jgi:hypothetical protein